VGLVSEGRGGAAVEEEPETGEERMNRTKIKNYAPQARRDFIQAVTGRAAHYGLTAKKVESVTEKGDLAIIAGRAFPKTVAAKRKRLEERIARDGFEQTMEALAYTWFNRLVAIRFMELHGYFEHGYRVLSNPDPAKTTPEILDHAEHVDLPGLNKDAVIELKLDGSKEAELYRLLLVGQCNALNAAMPFLFEKIDDETELLLPENLLHSDSIVRKLASEIDEEDWQEVEVIGWLYESYIAERYEAVIGNVVASEDIPAATQRFTPKWVVRYLVQNTIGRLWLSTYPQSPLKAQMRYYIEPAEQTPEVRKHLKAITPTSLNPEEITFLDPATGSAHILVEAYDLFKAIYQERGYNKREIPRLILDKNLFGLEIDERAAQLAAFAVLMKARADDRRILDGKTQPHVLALVQTKGMDAADIATALNVPILKEPLPPPDQLFEDEDTLFTKQRMSVAGDVSQTDVAALIALFEDAHNLGSLITMPPKLAARLPLIEQRARDVVRHAEDLFSATAASFLPVIEQAKMLAARYDCVAANPPYMGSKYYNTGLKAFIYKNYKDAKADLYACFIQRNCAFAKPNGFVGMITIPNWMFLSSFEEVRASLFDHQTIDTFVHNGRGVFGSDFGSCSFTFRNAGLPLYRGAFRRLYDKQGSVATNDDLESRFFTATTHTPSNSDFAKIPGSPVAFWAPPIVFTLFAGTKVGDVVHSEGSVKTGDNAHYIRCHWEVDFNGVSANGKWRKHPRGGDFRKWYGNVDEIVDWSLAAREHYRKDHVARILDETYWNLEAICWSEITMATPSFRVLLADEIANNKSLTVYPKPGVCKLQLLGFLNSHSAKLLLSLLNPTIGCGVGDVLRLPWNIERAQPERVADITRTMVEEAKVDWDSSETSCDFKSLLILHHRAARLQESQEAACAECQMRFCQMKQLEEENNRLFIDAYGLQDELSPEVPDEQITLYRPNREEDIKRLASYAIGCMMGRYSLAKPGLIYAHGGNVGFDPSQYKTFAADPDGIVPIMEGDWFADDASNRFFEFIGEAWPKEHLAENLKFVADSLGPAKNEQPRDTIRRYLATGFYKHHLSMYKRRPIYWLFSSGKQRAFQCLVYLHRYHEGTLARMRTEYVIPLQGKLTSRIDQLASLIEKATSASQRRDLQKERDKLVKQQPELQAFEEKLRHYAEMKIKLDLDDGVKVNYAKFGDLLAEVKAVTGGKDEE
jgi:hypothetical protein